MLQDLIRRLAGPPARAPLHPEDARLAMAALMVRVSRTDGHYAEAERLYQRSIAIKEAAKSLA